MPRTHVRFSPENTSHFLRMPPVYRSSISSAASSSADTYTPPFPAYAGLPGPTPYVPRRRSYTESAAGTACVHILIAYSDSPHLTYDLSLHPSSISIHYPGLSTGMLEPAVYPPQISLSIGTPHLPWSITVSASNGRYVTVSDVLTTLYRALRTNVTAAEFNALGTQKPMRRVTAAYEHRFMRLKGFHGYTEEKVHGVKRVDFLMGFTRFRGLSPTSAPDVWQLHVS